MVVSFGAACVALTETCKACTRCDYPSCCRPADKLLLHLLLLCTLLDAFATAYVQLLRAFGVSQRDVEREFSETMAMEV
jgi:hypothetical protein